MRIPLSQGKFAIVGPRDYAYLNQFKWCCHTGGYAIRNGPTVNGKHLVIYMHRVILERMGHTDFQQVDHINHDKLDNRRCNLRSATNRQNKCNCGKHCDNTSGFKGVHWYKRDKKWHAQIKMGEKKIHLGYFDDKLEAARAYNKAAKKYHGEFACLNEV